MSHGGGGGGGIGSGAFIPADSAGSRHTTAGLGGGGRGARGADRLSHGHTRVGSVVRRRGDNSGVDRGGGGGRGGGAGGGGKEGGEGERDAYAMEMTSTSQQQQLGESVDGVP